MSDMEFFERIRVGVLDHYLFARIKPTASPHILPPRRFNCLGERRRCEIEINETRASNFDFRDAVNRAESCNYFLRKRTWCGPRLFRKLQRDAGRIIPVLEFRGMFKGYFVRLNRNTESAERFGN